jgi:hypothetical protein
MGADAFSVAFLFSVTKVRNWKFEFQSKGIKGSDGLKSNLDFRLNYFRLKQTLSIAFLFNGIQNNALLSSHLICNLLFECA